VPIPIRTDGSNAFARFSMSERVPKILDEVIARNRDYPGAIKDAVRALRDGIAAGSPLPALGAPAPDAAFWLPGLAARRGDTWLAGDWFFVECYAYRSLVSAVRYFETGRDPFAPAKDEELAGDRVSSSLAAALDTASPLAQGERLHFLLGMALWGNRIDLSYAVGTSFGPRGTSDDLVVDDRVAAVSALASVRGAVHVLLDNAGAELAMDLALLDAVLKTAPCRIVLHVKMHPTFVSDATVSDVWALLATLKGVPGPVRELAQRIERAFWESRIVVVPDFFHNSAELWGARPPHLALDEASLVIAKGDANYRRLVGDTIWPEGATLHAALGGFRAPVLCLRTLKSDCIVGVPKNKTDLLDREDPAWRINARRGLVQWSAGG
jgi:damage-control phosphatase, subfamily III